MENIWVEEVFKDVIGLRFRVKEILFQGQSPFQKVLVVDTYGHGKALLNDGMLMVTERDEFVYHDMIVHPAMMTHPNPKKILVIGGGDGGTVREVLKYKSVEKVVMVEIDEMVTQACKDHIPQTSSKLGDPKVELRFEDGVKYVADTKEKFDVVIVDSSDPIGPATPLFNKDFYQGVYNVLEDDGIVVSQCESPYYEIEMQKTIARIKSELFSIVRMANYTNLSYPGGMWSFSFASKKCDPLKDFNKERYKELDGDFEYYNDQIHFGAFQIPNFQLKQISEYLSPWPNQ